ncbi:MAG: NfeD family protein [Thermoguttaceae bacterium]
MDYWIWAVLLLVLGLCLGIMEVFFTSAGLFAFLSAASIIVAVILAFQQGQMAGFIILILAMAGMPTTVVLAFKYWPRTSFGRRVLLSAPTSQDVLPEDQGKEYLKSLVGKAAKAKSKLLPSGVVLVDGRNVEAVTEGMPIEAGQEVRIVQVRGKRIVVRPIELDAPVETAQDPMRRPIDSILEDPFQDRPA